MSQITGFGSGSGGGGSVLTLTGNDMTAISPSAGGNINIVGDGVIVTTTNSAPNTMLITVVAASFTWNDITGTSATMVANNGYFADNAGLVTLTLPAVAAQGSLIEVTGGVNGLSTGSWKIAQPAGVTIHYGNQHTTTGAGGSLQSTNQYDSISIVCNKANTDWVVVPGTQGNITVV